MSTRDELIADLSRPEHAPMSDHDPRDGSCRSCPVPVWALGVADIADALIAEGWRKKPTRAEVATRLHSWFCGCADWYPGDPEDEDWDNAADAILALMDRGQ